MMIYLLPDKLSRVIIDHLLHSINLLIYSSENETNPLASSLFSKVVLVEALLCMKSQHSIKKQKI
jgi:hypothetical protein